MTPERADRRDDNKTMYPCVSCGSLLPISVCVDCDDAVSIVCAFCGTRYRGLVHEDHPLHEMENILILEE